jgi:hypothetical protein
MVAEAALEDQFVSKDSDQIQTASRKFKLGLLGNLNQVTKGLAKTIRAMADGTLDSQAGARICNGLGIMRACLETQRLEQLESRMNGIADQVTGPTGQPLRARGPATMKPSALRIERLLAKVEAELARSARPRRYCFYFDEEAEAEAQGLPYILVPRVLSEQEWIERYSPKPSVQKVK